MTEAVTPPTVTPPSLQAQVIYPQHMELRLTLLCYAIHAIAPNAVIGDWAGPFQAPPRDEMGTSMLSIDGVPLSIYNIGAAPPWEEIDPGICPYLLIQKPELERVRACNAHVRILVPSPEMRAHALQSARAVTLAAQAVAVVTKAAAVHWVDASNVASPHALMPLIDRLTKPGGTAADFWVRFLLKRDVPDATGRETLWLKTLGLWAFGVLEVEFQRVPLGLDWLLPHVSYMCDHLLKAGPVFKAGEQLELGGRLFRISSGDNGQLVMMLTEVRP